MTPGYLPVRADLRSLEHALLLALRYAELQSHGTVNRSIGVRVSERGTRELAVDIIDSGPGSAPDLTARYLDMPLGASPAANAGDEPDLRLAASVLRSFGGRLRCTSSKEDGTT